MKDPDVNKGASSASAGKAFYRDKKYLQAADAFSMSAGGYDADGAPLLAAEMRNNQAVALLMAKRPRQALEAVEGTSEQFLEAGEIKKAAMALANQATALRDLGESDKAIEFFLRAADSFRSSGEEEMYLQTMQSISSIKMKHRDLLGALFSMKSGLESLEKPTLRQKVLKSLLSIPGKLLGK